LKKVVFAAAGCAALLRAVALGTAPARVQSCNCVAFRLDDIQDYFLSSAQLKAMQVFEQRNENLTVGVIGNYFGSDPTIVNYVKSRIGDPSFEVANHGWNHEDFTGFDKDEQSALIQMTNEKIADVLGTRPAVFIALYNAVNDDTFSAAKESGIRYVSANMTYDPPPYDITGDQSLYRLPETALMGDLNADDTDWITFGHQEVFAKIEDSLDEHGFAVVTLHPQDFAVREMLDYQNAVDDQYIAELEMLLDRIEERGIKIVMISEISNNVPQELGIFVESAQPRKED
jgi:peptidoglycan-N-acetylglucosamine deacetylase